MSVPRVYVQQLDLAAAYIAQQLHQISWQLAGFRCLSPYRSTVPSWGRLSAEESARKEGNAGLAAPRCSASRTRV